MVNTKLLDVYIKESGLKVFDIASSLNISEISFWKKKNNIKDFKVSEMDMLCDILNIGADAVNIFFP